jgi:hypothetical protein
MNDAKPATIIERGTLWQTVIDLTLKGKTHNQKIQFLGLEIEDMRTDARDYGNDHAAQIAHLEKLSLELSAPPALEREARRL